MAGGRRQSGRQRAALRRSTSSGLRSGRVAAWGLMVGWLALVRQKCDRVRDR